MQCQYIKSNGKQCGGYAVNGSRFCFSHDPNSKKEHLKAVKKGGRVCNDDKLQVLPPIDLSTSEGIESLLKDTINRIRRVDKNGGMEEKTAQTIGNLVEKLHNIHMKGYPEDKLREIEKREAILKQKEEDGNTLCDFGDSPKEQRERIKALIKVNSQMISILEADNAMDLATQRAR